MKHHNGMRPHDIAVLLKIVLSEDGWLNKDLSAALKISPAEISYSLSRSALAGLLDVSKKKVRRQALLEFLQHGLPYVFPAIKGQVTKGVPTAYAAPVMSDHLVITDIVVWSFSKGKARGESVVPLYPNLVEAVLEDKDLYDVLALVEVLRMGKVREKEYAVKLLKQIFDRSHA
ncbi:hypothetical protein GFS24_19000 [Chitinophaga sp. SYP-B3965]|uniref:hypothetical protein n=1 Tax=Chitinophaga sp. SYP-B3965 TaxID=2663120 RepID=UPI001299848F|nr:hypothetical protein [Chitinophaga sp. SYP-B3965]MRG47217.1 hypothetical protein [Chitinophaga sp. SYP-B3965]